MNYFSKADEDSVAIRQMELHDIIQTDVYEILRVYKGWIYTITSKNGEYISSVYVPFGQQS